MNSDRQSINILASLMRRRRLLLELALGFAAIGLALLFKVPALGAASLSAAVATAFAYTSMKRPCDALEEALVRVSRLELLLRERSPSGRVVGDEGR